MKKIEPIFWHNFKTLRPTRVEKIPNCRSLTFYKKISKIHSNHYTTKIDTSNANKKKYVTSKQSFLCLLPLLQSTPFKKNPKYHRQTAQLSNQWLICTYCFGIIIRIMNWKPTKPDSEERGMVEWSCTANNTRKMLNPLFKKEGVFRLSFFFSLFLSRFIFTYIIEGFRKKFNPEGYYSIGRRFGKISI